MEQDKNLQIESPIQHYLQGIWWFTCRVFGREAGADVLQVVFGGFLGIYMDNGARKGFCLLKQA